MNHENILPHRWIRGNIVFNLFRKPGTPVSGLEFEHMRGVMNWISWQTRPRSIPIQTFRNRQESVLQLLHEGLQLIEDERAVLSPDDYTYLSGCFKDARYIIRANQLLGEAAYALNLAEENYDDHPDPVAYAHETIDRMEAFAEEIIKQKGNDFFRPPAFFVLTPSLPESLLAIAANYRSIIKEL